MEIVAARYALTMNHAGVIPRGAVAIENGMLCGVGTLDALQTEFPQASVTEFPNGVLMPGLINAHCHLDRTGFYEKYSIATDTPISPVAWYLEGLHYLANTPSEEIAQKIKNSLAHCKQTGITTLGTMTHYEGTYPLVKGSGLRGVVYQEILGGPNEEAQKRFEVALALVEKQAPSSPLVKMGLAPYAAYVLSRNMLNIIARHAKDGSLPLQIHLAESFAEMEFFYNSKGPIAEQLFPVIGWEELPPAHHRTPVQHLSDIEFFITPTTIVGGLQLSSNDYHLLRRHLIKVVFCPSANGRLKFGMLPWGKLREFGIPVALGTDLFSDTEGFNLWQEMRLAREASAIPAPSAEEVLRMATLNGARALQLEAVTGSLENGKQADYLVLELALDAEESAESLSQKIIAYGGPGQIRRVAVAGQPV